MVYGLHVYCLVGRKQYPCHLTCCCFHDYSCWREQSSVSYKTVLWAIVLPITVRVSDNTSHFPYGWQSQLSFHGYFQINVLPNEGQEFDPRRRIENPETGLRNWNCWGMGPNVFSVRKLQDNLFHFIVDCEESIPGHLCDTSATGFLGSEGHKWITARASTKRVWWGPPWWEVAAQSIFVSATGSLICGKCVVNVVWISKN